MAFEKRITFHESDRKPVQGMDALEPVRQDEEVQVTVVLRRKTSTPTGQRGNPPALSRKEFSDLHGATDAHVSIVEKFAQESGLTVHESSASKRTVKLSGPAKAMESAFGTTLRYYRDPKRHHTFRGRSGALSVPEELEPAVLAILGLDTRPTAKPHFRASKKAAKPAGTFTPPQVAALYRFPSNATGEGQTIGIIELGGGYQPEDLNTYFQSLGVKAPTVVDVSVDDGANTPGTDSDGEVLLDIEVAGSIAPAATIAVYFAPNTDQGFHDAIVNSVHDATNKPSVISISWGQSEDGWTTQARNAMNAALEDAVSLGVTVTVAAGDDGSSDGETDGEDHVDFPASSPYVLACGGTKLQGSGQKITSEVVWNETAIDEGATGGGVSKYFAIPDWQTDAGVPKQSNTGFAGRGVPDVAGDADPSTGYQILIDGQTQIVGGTSAVAPLWAALIALINQQKGSPVGFMNTVLYQNASAFRDITEGNNGSFSAGPGWDACTGMGSPDGSAVAALFATT